MEAQTNAVAARANDVVIEQDVVFRQVEEAYQRELSALRKLHSEKDTAILRLEKMMRNLEEDNYKLHFDLMAHMEGNAKRPGPDILLRERDTLIRMLRSGAGPSTTLIAIHEGESDTFEFGIEMRSILESAGWNVQFMTSSFENGRFYGLQIVTDSSEMGDSAARLLSGAFEKVGIPFVSRTAPTPKNLSPLRLIIGQNNW